MKTKNPRSTFVENFMIKIKQGECTKSITESKCNAGHPFQRHVRQIAIAMFNVFGVNIANEANSLIHAEKKRKTVPEKSSNTRKVINLTSGLARSSANTTGSGEDCGSCKFCKDKKKFGGKGTLKKRCQNKEKM